MEKEEEVFVYGATGVGGQNSMRERQEVSMGGQHLRFVEEIHVAGGALLKKGWGLVQWGQDLPALSTPFPLNLRRGQEWDGLDGLPHYFCNFEQGSWLSSGSLHIHIIYHLGYNFSDPTLELSYIYCLRPCSYCLL